VGGRPAARAPFRGRGQGGPFRGILPGPRPLPGAIELLERLRAASVVHGIATSGRHPEIDRSLEVLGVPSETVVVDRGPVLTNVRISPEMCSLWLKYVVPVAADSVPAEGKFPLSPNGAHVAPAPPSPPPPARPPSPPTRPILAGAAHQRIFSFVGDILHTPATALTT